MPGSLVTDGTPFSLQASASISSTTTTTGVLFTGVKGTLYRVKLSVGTNSGTTPTLDVEVQGSDASAFGSGVVSYGRFGQLSSADVAATSPYYLEFVPQHDYVRLSYTIGGSATPTFNTVVVTVEECNYLRTKGDKAT